MRPPAHTLSLHCIYIDEYGIDLVSNRNRSTQNHVEWCDGRKPFLIREQRKEIDCFLSGKRGVFTHEFRNGDGDKNLISYVPCTIFKCNCDLLYLLAPKDGLLLVFKAAS